MFQADAVFFTVDLDRLDLLPPGKQGFDPAIDYYGYFLTDMWYVSLGNLFVEAAPKSARAKAANEWDGNFLNWLTMRKVEIARKVLRRDVGPFSGWSAQGDLAGVVLSWIAEALPRPKQVKSQWGGAVWQWSVGKDKFEYPRRRRRLRSPHRCVRRGRDDAGVAARRVACAGEIRVARVVSAGLRRRGDSL